MTKNIRCGTPATLVAALAFASAAASVACTADVPSTPSFQQDIMPILAANCVRCHSYPTLGGAPEYFRLDVFGDVIVRDGRPRTVEEGPCGLTPTEAQGVLCGAASLAGISASRAGSDNRPMPPRFRMEDHQIATLDVWAQLPQRGEARPGNHVPTATIVQIPATGRVLQLEVTVADEDRDLVVGELWIDVGGIEKFVGAVRSGTHTIEWLSTGAPVGTYAVIARLDDGALVHDVPAGQLTIGGI
ncbi:MAG: hypothetical protein KBG15_22435 [Kofleriaceae bacterium]|nr:hypothetical protein [Kofleriaceae bacterium]